MASLGLFFLFLLSFTPNSWSAEHRLAVLDLQADNIDAGILLKIGDQIRLAALESLPVDQYELISRENMLQILSDMGKDASCIKGVCEVEIARNIGASVVISGDLLYWDERYSLTLKIHESRKGRLIMGEEIRAPDVWSLLDRLEPKVKNMMQRLLNMEGGYIERGFSDGEDVSWQAESERRQLVSFETEPSKARVIWRGQVLCAQTPCSKSLPEGIQIIQIQKDGFETKEERLDISEKTRLSISLRPQFGWLSVDIAENVALLLDGSPLGKTPIRRKRIPLGVHEISVSDPCFTGPKYQFFAKQGEEEEVVDYPLTPRLAGVYVAALDKNRNEVVADVKIDGVVYGKTPITITVPLCSQRLQLVYRGRTIETGMSLREKKTSTMRISVDDPSLLGYEAVDIPKGQFLMGCGSEQGDRCAPDEKPSHRVAIDGFRMMRTEVTQSLYRRIMGENPSGFSDCGSQCPVEKVSWYNAIEFANALSKKEGLSECYRVQQAEVLWVKGCTGWRLPTEAEWEYAARGGEAYRYAGSSKLDSVAWYGDYWWNGHDWERRYYSNSKNRTHPVCTKKKNGFGLCDMSGNVYEWVWDYYAENIYQKRTKEVQNPSGPATGGHRIFRGGSWNFDSLYARVSSRLGIDPHNANDSLGFRLVQD
ncbi:MAG: SUMF1/EgtB/PvdO family nonheme iron enzyme [Myxococcota bacterium]|nr:SUMF1/EgtB/PvdO family nonheme iron enzyme [Myxococcota bacterium]